MTKLGDNILLGSTSFRETGIYSNATAYNLGQDLGDVVSVFIGGSEILTGLEEMAGGVIATPETAGVSFLTSSLKFEWFYNWFIIRKLQLCVT